MSLVEKSASALERAFLAILVLELEAMVVRLFRRSNSPTFMAIVESRSRKSEQDDRWNFCLTTAIVAVNRRNHEQTTPPEPLTGLQGEGGSGRRQGRPHNRPAGGAFRRSPQSDHGMEIAA